MRQSDRLWIPFSISGKSEVGKKQRGPDLNRVLIDEGNSVSNPFSQIVLKEKKEEKKEIKTEKKKPGEIVHGYNPSLSFADILSSYEKTGDPYRMPKKSASGSSSSFGDILDEWENGKSKTPKKKIQRQENRSSYQATKSFAAILDEYEGVYRKEESRKSSNKNTSDASSNVDNLLRGSTLFLEESEDEKVGDNVSWSVIGGANKNYVRKEEQEREIPKKKEYKRTSPGYTPSSTFGSLLDEYEKKKTNTVKTENKVASQPVKEELSVKETTFFIENEEEKVPDNVSWSVLGGANRNYVRKEPEEKHEEKEEPVKEVKRISKHYTPKKSFGEILSSYSKEKKNEIKSEVDLKKERDEGINPSPDEPFFMKGDDTLVPDTVSWSIIGGANPDYVRKEDPESSLLTREIVKKETNKKTVASEPYSPSSSFSDILAAYEEKKSEKTFSQIIEEKGDSRKKKASLTINELRRMGVQATLDLHGETQKDSEEMISSFLSESHEHGLRKVSIITGKGLHSETGSSVLRDLAFSILSGSPLVQEVSPAPLTRGGSGALWVILKEKS